MSTVRVLITVGTHEQPFQRLLDAVALVAASDVDAEFVAQYGLATFDPRLALHADAYFSHDELLRWNDWADLAIVGGSPGGVFDATAHGTAPFIVPRRHHLGEHVNDHQVEFGERMAELGLATLVHGGDSPESVAVALSDAIAEIAAEDPGQRAARIESIAAASRERTERFIDSFAAVVDPLLTDPPRRFRRRRT